MNLNKKKKPKGGRGCKVILLVPLLVLTSCTIPVKIVPSDDQITKVSEVVQNQGQALQEIIKVLREKQIIGESNVQK